MLLWILKVHTNEKVHNVKSKKRNGNILREWHSFKVPVEIQFRFRRRCNKYTGIYVPFHSRQVSTTGAVYKTLFYSYLRNQRSISALSSPPQTEMMEREDFISRHVGVWFDRALIVAWQLRGEKRARKIESNRNCELPISDDSTWRFVQRRENNYGYNRRFIRFAARLSRVDIPNTDAKRQL